MNRASMTSIRKRNNKLAILILLALIFILFVGCMNELTEQQNPQQPHPNKPKPTSSIEETLVVKDRTIDFEMSISETFKSYEADEGYKFVAFDIVTKNIGIETNYFPLDASKMKLIVDKGYKYNTFWADTRGRPPLRPEEVGKGTIVFEILKDTNPTELHLENSKHILKIK